MQTNPSLNTDFLHVQAQVALHHHLDQQHQNHAAVHDRDRQQVDDRQLQADHRHQHEERGRALARGVAGKLRDADRARQVLRGHAPLHDAFEELHHQQRALLVLPHRFARARREARAWS